MHSYDIGDGLTVFTSEELTEKELETFKENPETVRKYCKENFKEESYDENN